MAASTLTLEALADYLYCPFYYYLAHGHAEDGGDCGRKVATSALPGKVFKAALKVYATGKYPGVALPVLVHQIWGVWLAEAGVSAGVLPRLAAYAARREEVLAPFLSGRFRKRDGKPYIEPRLAARYARMCAAAGLKNDRALIETQLEGFGAMPVDLGKLGRYWIADAYADALIMAATCELPAPEEIVGVDVPGVAVLTEKYRLALNADVVVRAGAGCVIEVLDPRPLFYLDRARVSRKLDVIAAAAFEGVEGEMPPVSLVRYRHLLSGTVVERRHARLARLLFALIGAARGIEAGVFVPEFLNADLSKCRACRLAADCLGEDEDFFEYCAPGIVAWNGRG